MVQSGMAPSQARERLLAAAVEQALRGGIVGQSLRQIAAAIGTSHRMLLYHFGSSEGLLVAISNEINEAVAGALDRWKDPRELFQHFTDPAAWPWERLFFELYTHALFGRPGTEGFVEAAVHRWIDGLAGELVKAGTDEARARVQARLHLAVARGLLLDLLATEEREEVNQAYEYYLQLAGQAARGSALRVLPVGQRLLGILIPRLSPLPQPGQPVVQALPGVVVSEIRLQAKHLHEIVAGRGFPVRCEQFRVRSQQVAQFVQAALTGQPAGQVPPGVSVACPGPPPQFVRIVALGQPASQPELSGVVVSVGQRTDHRHGLVDLAPVGQPTGQLAPRVVVSRLGMPAKFIDAVVLGQHVRPPPSCLVLGYGIR